MHEQTRDPDRARRLRVYQEEASACTRCRAQNHLFVDPAQGSARPILARSPTGAVGVLIVGEAPNYGDTFDPAKGHLTYDADTDPTGRFMQSLLLDEAGLLPDEVNDVLFSNVVLCLPRRRNGKHPVSAQQLDACKPWLARLIHDAEVTIVVTMGAVALRAVGRIERHGLTLARDAGRVHAWYGRKLLPLYHAGLLGRISRKETLIGDKRTMSRAAILDRARKRESLLSGYLHAAKQFPHKG